MPFSLSIFNRYCDLIWPRQMLIYYNYTVNIAFNTMNCSNITQSQHPSNLAIDIVARLAIINAIAVADIEPRLGAITPDGVLHEPQEEGREGRIERTGVDLLGRQSNNVSAAAGPIAGRAIGVVSLESAQDAGAVQEVVHQRVDGDHAGTDVLPSLVASRGGQQNAGQGHGQHLVRHAVDLAQWLDQAGTEPGRAVGIMRPVGFMELSVDPADQVAIGDVPDKQVERIGGLIEPTVAQVMARHWAVVDMVRLGAGAAAFVVPAAIEMPVAGELRAGGAVTELGVDVVPPRSAVRLHVVEGHAIRDALIAQRRHQPIE